MFNVIRPQDEPQSLSKKKKYDGEDVYIALKKAFFDKCYLCETKEPQDVHIEHFDAHQGDHKKKFDWNNLYFVCSRCNSIKGTKFNNLIDCCDEKTDVSRLIKLLPPHTPYSKNIQVEATSSAPQVNETRVLLDKIYNSEHTINKRVTGSFIRKKIFTQYKLLLEQLNIYYAEFATEEDMRLAVERIKVLCDKKSAYSAFIRWCIYDDEKLGPMLKDYMD
ncbi:hypothetical protein DBT73_RS15105 [Vibrio parahaemolyticus]|uniref:hypothetical protein n=1 Tax=Vibrio parahaemolyticus TaxID=670 RepID=UPI0017A6403E|nr:hypothetical protein [Vibrio parahaemolyticus]NVJ67514.1 hypothetical protein [Gammaproteobacteria bacterium]EGR2844251.1 hypothetical protein [Vibrio parahaemolyticus]EGR2845741.1 hypothetical protein [Vibrio parahaemolyticus]EGR3040679.1 hypothetical protein [Vibrio parahaemolyticus]EGR3374369.1 hypothetical protein [Vibrio parahaemolyticus]